MMILYSSLDRDLLDLDVLLAYYPGHLATAVNINTPVNGEYINLNGKRFTICDPTYIGALIGATMPDMDNKLEKVFCHLKAKYQYAYSQHPERKGVERIFSC